MLLRFLLNGGSQRMLRFSRMGGQMLLRFLLNGGCAGASDVVNGTSQTTSQALIFFKVSVCPNLFPLLYIYLNIIT